MSSTEATLEKRRSFRFPVLEHREGELRFDEKRINVELLDESFGGFCVSAEDLRGVENGAIGLLHRGDDWFRVRITSICPWEEEEKEKDASESETSEVPVTHRVRVGLCRLEETFDPDRRSSYYSWAGLSSIWRVLKADSSGVLFLGIVFASLVLVVPMVVLWLPTPSSSNVAQGQYQIDSWGETGGSERTESSKAFSRTWRGGASNRHLDEYAVLRETIRTLPGAKPFTLPEVIGCLKLTDDQLKSIHELLDSAVDRITDTVKSTGDGPTEEGKPVPVLLDSESMREKVLRLLSRQQQLKWYEISGELEKEAPPDAAEKK